MTSYAALLFLTLALQASPDRHVVKVDASTSLRLGPPICVFTPEAERFVWANSSNYLEVHARSNSSTAGRPSSTRSIHVVDWRTRQSINISDQPPRWMEKTKIDWFDDDYFVVTLSGSTRDEHHSATVQEVGLMLYRGLQTQSGIPWTRTLLMHRSASPETISASALVSTKHSYAAVSYQSEQKPAVRIVNFARYKSTLVSPQSPLVLDADGFLIEPFKEDGRPTGLARRYLPDGASEIRVHAVAPPPMQSVGLQVVSSHAVHRLGDVSVSTSGIWLKSALPSQQQYVLVAASGGRAETSPDQSAVAYIDNGNVFVRQLIPLDAKDNQHVIR